MTVDQIAAFLAFALVAAITPGPSNTMIAAAGARSGFAPGIPCALGAGAGMGLLLFATSMGLGQIFLAHPLIGAAMQWLGAAFLLWLAWRIARSAGPSEQQQKPVTGFLGATLFQWLNPKGWLVAVSAAGVYLTPGSASPARDALILGGLFFLVAFPSGLVWLGFASMLRKLLRDPAKARIFNIAMGLALALSVLAILDWKALLPD